MIHQPPKDEEEPDLGPAASAGKLHAGRGREEERVGGVDAVITLGSSIVPIGPYLLPWSYNRATSITFQVRVAIEQAGDERKDCCK